MSKLADYNTIEARISLFAEELKEISKTSKLTPEIIDFVADSYIDMIPCYGLTVFARDEDKIIELIDDLFVVDEDEGNVLVPDTEILMERFDKEGIDYILDKQNIK